MSRLTMALSAALLCLTAAGPAHAFHGGKSFELSANAGGGGGIFFTGAARWKRYDCSICHVGSNGGVSIAVTSTPAELITRGEWEPGTTYEIVLELLGESRGFESGANINTFVAEITDQAGNPVGSFDFDASELATWSDGHVIGARGNPDRTRWTFHFTAPPRGTGAIALDIGMVDGNGAGVSPGRASDLHNDGVATAHHTLCEAGAPCPRDAEAPEPSDAPPASGCSASGSSAGWLLPAMTLFLLLGSTRRSNSSRRRSRPAPRGGMKAHRPRRRTLPRAR
jgi:hypothetical protein